MVLTRNTALQLISNPQVLEAIPSLKSIDREVSQIRLKSNTRGCGGCGSNMAGPNGVSISSLGQKALAIIENSTPEQIDVISKELRASVLYVYSKDVQGNTVLKKVTA